MYYSSVTPAEKRTALRRRLDTGELTVLPGVFNALSAQLLQRRGADGVYISGHMIAADLGLPDLGMTTITEVADRGRQIARMVDLPAIIDADTGFGEPLNVGRSIQALEDAGIAGCHIEDQVNPKKCGHSDGIAVVDPEAALRRIEAAVCARRDPGFLVIARTDARAVEGLDAAIGRARAFVEAGADVVFPEALQSPDEYAAFRHAVDVPLMINMNEFGRGTPPTQAEARNLGYQIAVYPVTLLRLAMRAALEGVDEILHAGSQHRLLDRMQTKDELYDLLEYGEYQAFDDAVFRAAATQTGSH